METSPRDELDALLDALFSFAHQQIEQHGEFFPFAAAISASGELRMVATHTGDEQPLSQDVIDDLYRVLTAEAASGAIRAAGVCADVLVTPSGQAKTDAVRADLEHAAADAIRVFLPYRNNGHGEYEFGELFAEPGAPRLRFANPS
ncbi:MAG TPA: hypothetical protein VHD91_05170 [Gaiellaceae bacterium]|nr:hypothetical protein [Gaiellaceae bacterium]